MADKLVTVIISSYNSSQFIVETLESIAGQTWKDIELIITDDCSGDDTVEVCRKWKDENKERFVNALILTNNRNTGVSANANRGLSVAKGNWIKFLGADDTLKQDCIEENMLHVISDPGIRVLFSKVDIYNNDFGPGNRLSTSCEDTSDPWSIMATGRSAYSQYKMLLISDRLKYTPSVFLHRETLLSVGGFDERFRLLEDYPLWLNLTKNGHRLYYMDKVTVNYRQHSKAINNTGTSYLVNFNYFRTEDFRKIYTYPYLPADVRLSQRFRWYASQIFRWDYLNRDRKAGRILLNLLTIYCNPFRYFIWVRKRFNKKLEKNELYN